MEPQANSAKPTNPLLAHLNDVDESHASTRVDFMHPGTVVQPQYATSNEISTPAPAPTEPVDPPPPPIVPTAPVETPPPGPAMPPAPKSPHNNKPLVIIIIIILLLAALGGGAYWWFKIRKTTTTTPTTTTSVTTATAVVPTGLTQTNSTGQTVAAGGALKSPLNLNFTMTTSANSGSVEAQVEVEPLGAAFANQPNYKGSDVTPSGSAVQSKVAVTDLKDGAYHWQARYAVGTSVSDWVPFAATGVTAADFTIDSTVPAAAVVTGVGAQTVGAGQTTLTTTANPTTISGTAEVGDAISVTIAPDSQTATATASTTGAWNVTLQQALANGSHTVTITATDMAGNVSTSTFTVSSNTTAAAPATQKIAATGDNTRLVTLISGLLVVVSAAGLILVTRLDRRQT